MQCDDPTRVHIHSCLLLSPSLSLCSCVTSFPAAQNIRKHAVLHLDQKVQHDACLLLPSDGRLVFSEGIPFASDQDMQYYTSARKFQSTLDLENARSLYRRLSKSKDALVQAASLTRLGELEVNAGHLTEGIALLTEGLVVCVGAGRRDTMMCGKKWVGWGLGSCCAIASMSGWILQEAGQQRSALSMLRLARDLTPSVRLWLCSLECWRNEKLS